MEEVLLHGLGSWTTQKRESKLSWNTYCSLLLDCKCHMTGCLEFPLPQPPNYSSECTCHRVHTHGQVCNCVKCARSLDRYSKAVNSDNPFLPRVALVRYFVTVARRVTNINSVDIIKNYLALPPDALKCHYPYRFFLFSCDTHMCKGLGFMLFKGTDVLKSWALLNSRCLI